MNEEDKARPVVLLAIADWQSRALIRAQLTEDGYQVRASTSVEDALRVLLRGEWPDLAAIVVEISQGPVDERLAHSLDSLKTSAPVVALTGAFGPSPAELRQMGVQTVLARPFAVGEVSSALKRLSIV